DAPATGEAAPGQDTERGGAGGETGTVAGATSRGTSAAERDQAGPGGGPGASGQPTAGGRPEAGARPGTDRRPGPAGRPGIDVRPGPAGRRGVAVRSGTGGRSGSGGPPTSGGRLRRRRVTIVAVTALALIAGTLAGVGIARSGGGPATPEFALVPPYPPAMAA